MNIISLPPRYRATFSLVYTTLIIAIATNKAMSPYLQLKCFFFNYNDDFEFFP